MARLHVLLGVAITSVACQRATTSAQPEARPRALVQPVRTLSFAGPRVERPDAGASQIFWTRAESGQPQDLALLAEREGAGALLARVRRGGPLGRIALAAFADAADAPLYLGRLCELLEVVVLPERVLIVEAIGRTASVALSAGEADVGRCEELVSAIGQPNDPREIDALAAAASYL